MTSTGIWQIYRMLLQKEEAETRQDLLAMPYWLYRQIYCSRLSSITWWRWMNPLSDLIIVEQGQH